MQELEFMIHNNDKLSMLGHCNKPSRLRSVCNVPHDVTHPCFARRNFSEANEGIQLPLVIDICLDKLLKIL